MDDRNPPWENIRQAQEIKKRQLMLIDYTRNDEELNDRSRELLLREYEGIINFANDHILVNIERMDWTQETWKKETKKYFRK